MGKLCDFLKDIGIFRILVSLVCIVISCIFSWIPPYFVLSVCSILLIVMIICSIRHKPRDVKNIEGSESYKQLVSLVRELIRLLSLLSLSLLLLKYDSKELQGKIVGDFWNDLVDVLIILLVLFLIFSAISFMSILMGTGGVLFMPLLWVVLILLDWLGSDLIGMMTWFLPILIPVFIGKAHHSSTQYSLKTPTPALKKHVYRLQVIIFNTLLTLNIIWTLTTKQIIKKGQIEQVNNFKNWLCSFFKMPTEHLISSILFSTVILLISLFLAIFLSECMIKLIRKTYLENSDKYFSSRSSHRKYHQSHKRR